MERGVGSACDDGVRATLQQSEPCGRSTLRFAYLSGAPRIATHVDAENAGPRAHILSFVGALRAAGHEVVMYVVGDHVTRRLTGVGSRRFTGGSAWRRLVVDLARLALRARAARQARAALVGPFDVVYERYALFQELGRSFQRRGAPWVVESNALLSQEARSERGAVLLHRLAGVLERRTYRAADLVVAVSHPLRDELVERFGVAPDRVVVVPNAVDCERFRSQPMRPRAPSGHLVVGYVGCLVARQSLDDLIRALSLLRSSDLRVRAVLVGDGPDRDRLSELAAGLGVLPLVEFAGQVPWERVPQLIAGFSVGYSGQRGVGGLSMYHSPLKIYEYLAVGRPVVASAHPDAEQVVAAAGAGWTFPAGDCDALARVLRNAAVLDHDELAALGRRGAEHVRRTHTWRHRADQVVDELCSRSLVP
ncbi:MAG: glycosyl transferase group 1 [Frankiales bacterium]|nr:glycosyl transferase group 1 [Frankiales bacterium]